MKKLNIYALNATPCKTDSNISARKTEIINAIFENINKTNNDVYEMSEVKILSFRPKPNSGYTTFIEEYVYKIAKYPCILIFNSLFDIAHIPRTAYNRLGHMLQLDKIHAIYFSDYSLEKDAKKYVTNIKLTYNINAPDFPKRNRVAEHPKELKEKIRELRKKEPPVQFSDLENITGISSSSLRSIAKGNSEHGREITSIEEKELQAIVNKIHNNVTEKIKTYAEIFEHTYITQKQEF